MNKKFKLQKVLDYRSLILEKEKAKLAELVMRENEILRHIEALNVKIRGKYEELSIEEDFNIQDMYRKYIATLENLRRQTQKALADQRMLIHKQKNTAIEAFQNKSIVEKLKERHAADYSAYNDRMERLVTEDIVMTRKAAELIQPEA